MSFQWIIDNAESISINRKKQISQTVARDGKIRSVSRGTQPKRIEVKLPNGIPWTTLRSNIIAAEDFDRNTIATITIPYSKFPWYYNNVNPGTDETYTVICMQFPEWTIFARNQVSWSGPFVFLETA